MSFNRLFHIALIGLFSTQVLLSQDLYTTKNSFVYFTSDAPLEIIRAHSRNLQGIINTKTNEVAFKVNIISFGGFNSNLQKTHFNESFMETSIYPMATFEGNIIEDLDFSEGQKYDVTVEGILNLHGVEKENVFKGTLEKNGDKLTVISSFTFNLEEYNIKVPRIVYKKIAENVEVKIRADLRK